MKINSLIKLSAKAKMARFLVSIYFIFTCPLAFLFVYSEYFRFQTFQQIAYKKSHFNSPKIVFIGDSITVELKNYWYKFDLTPFDQINLAANGLTTRQINNLLDGAIELNPRYIFIMAGTNDLSDDRLSDEKL